MDSEKSQIPHYEKKVKDVLVTLSTAGGNHLEGFRFCYSFPSPSSESF